MESHNETSCSIPNPSSQKDLNNSTQHEINKDLAMVDLEYEKYIALK